MPEQIDPFGIVGKRLDGKYEVAEIIGETSFSVVYRAEHTVWRRSVAIKAFKVAGDLTDENRNGLLANFIREGALLTELSERCTAICQARDVASFTTDAGQWVPYMVLEWVDGEALDLVLERERAQGARPRSPGEALALLDPVAEALALAHSRGIIHCDVKPGNILILRDTQDARILAKLLDFGLARVLRDSGTAEVVEGSFTPAYGAPEQWSSAYGAQGPATDVFALAIIFVELLAGRDALAGIELADVQRQCCDPLRRPTPRSLGAVVGDEVERVLLRALAVDPANRFANVQQFRQALAAAAASPKNAEPAMESEVVIALSPKPLRRPSALAASFVVGTCAVGWQVSSQSIGHAASLGSLAWPLPDLPAAAGWITARGATASTYAPLFATLCVVASALCIGTLFSVSWLSGRARMMADGPEIGRLSMHLFRRWTVPSLAVSLGTGAAWCATVTRVHPWLYGVALAGLAMIGLSVTVGQRASSLAHGISDAGRGEAARRLALLVSVLAAVALAVFQPRLLP